MKTATIHRAVLPAALATALRTFIVAAVLTLVASAPTLASAAVAAGDLDATFSGDGRVMTPVGGTGPEANSTEANALALDDSGRIIVAGHTQRADLSYEVVLARYNRDGALDTSFGPDGTGVVTTPAVAGQGDLAYALGIDSQGRIVVAGYATRSSCERGYGTWDCEDFEAWRYLSDGTLDPAFGNGGRVEVGFGDTNDEAFALAIDPQDRILLGGQSLGDTSASSAGFALARLTVGGTLDASFGNGGKVTTVIDSPGAGPGAMQAVDVDSQGRIVAAGRSAGPTWDFAVARYTADGTLDPSFAGDGLATTNFSSGSTDEAFAVTTDASDRPVVAGRSARSGGGQYAFALARYNNDGTLDGSFGGGGTLLTPMLYRSGARALALDGHGRIVATGGAQFSDGWTEFGVARYGSDGVLDPSFGTSGVALVDFDSATAGRSNGQANGAAIDGQGRIVAAGGVEPNITLPPHFAVARLIGDPPPTLSIGDVRSSETDSGTTTFSFPVTLSSAAGCAASASWATADGTATAADNDYVPASGTVTIAAGDTSATIDVAVKGDIRAEADETFTVTLSNPTCATLGTATGTGTIVNDDFTPAVTSVSPADGATAVPVGASIRASFDRTLTSYSLVVTTTGNRPKSISGTLSCDNPCTTVTFTPARKLSTLTTYRATTTGTNAAGTSPSKTWTFTTRPGGSR